MRFLETIRYSLRDRWDSWTVVKRILIVVAILAAGGIFGAFGGSTFTVLYGLGLAVLSLVVISAFLWFPEVAKTIIAQIFFLPLALLAAQQQAYIVAPLAPLPQITAAPVIFWAIIVCVVVHLSPVRKKWVRTVVVVLTAAFSGWLFADLFGPYGVVAGYVLSGILLYFLTYGWKRTLTLVGGFGTRRALRHDGKENAASDWSGDGSALVAAATLVKPWQVYRNVRLPIRGGEVVLPALAISTSGVMVFGSLGLKGVVREDADGVKVGSVDIYDELTGFLYACNLLGKRLGANTDDVRPVLVLENAIIKKNRSYVSVSAGGKELQRISLIKSEAIHKEAASLSGKLPQKAVESLCKAAEGLTEGGTPEDNQEA